MPTKAELKLAKKHIKPKLRAGDKVMIIAGKDKGQEGYIFQISPTEQKAFVVQDNPENPDQPLPLNAMIKHKKARYQGERSARMKLPAPIHVSNLMLLDPKDGKPTRVGRKREDGKLVRVAKKSGQVVPEPTTPTVEEKE